MGSTGDHTLDSLKGEVSKIPGLSLKFPELFGEKASYKAMIIRSYATSCVTVMYRRAGRLQAGGRNPKQYHAGQTD